MRPALSMRNPVTFDWSGSVLTIYVDDVAVATWDWAEKKIGTKSAQRQKGKQYVKYNKDNKFKRNISN